MNNEALPGENNRRGSQLPEVIEVLWINGGLSCDGESVAITGATQPSIEDLIMGAIPGLPKVKFHNPFLSYENGDEFMDFFYRAEAGRLEPFILVVEGSIPNEDNKGEGYWATFGADKQTGQPITTCEWIDRLASKAWAVVAVGTCAAYGGIHAMHGNPMALVSSEAAEPLLRRMRENLYGRDACIIGEVKQEPQGIVAMRTGFGGTRIVDMLVGEQLPRIC